MAEFVRHLASTCAFTALQNKINCINDSFVVGVWKNTQLTKLYACYEQIEEERWDILSLLKAKHSISLIILCLTTGLSTINCIFIKKCKFGWDVLLNSCSTNLSRLCDLSESLAEFQDQLLNAMTATASLGGICCDVDTLRSRYRYGNKHDTCLVQESSNKDREISRLKKAHTEELQKVEVDLKFAQKQLRLIREELRIAKDVAARYKERLDLMGDYKFDVCRLKNKIRMLESEIDCLKKKLPYKRSRSCSPPRDKCIRVRCYSPPARPSDYYCIPVSTTNIDDYYPSTRPTCAERSNSIRHSRLLARFNDLYTINRLDMQDRLRRYVCDDDMVKRIIFIAVCESFQVAKMAYRASRLRARRLLAPCHAGPCSLEAAVLDYIVRNFELYDVDRSVDDVIRAMNVNPKISFPPECEFVLLSSFVREACKIAYEMQALDPVLEVAYATEGELYCESKYRRNYDSELSAPLVALHIWPALMEGCSVLVKGECITRHGAKRGRSRSTSSKPSCF